MPIVFPPREHVRQNAGADAVAQERGAILKGKLVAHMPEHHLISPSLLCHSRVGGVHPPNRCDRGNEQEGTKGQERNARAAKCPRKNQEGLPHCYLRGLQVIAERSSLPRKRAKMGGQWIEKKAEKYHKMSVLSIVKVGFKLFSN
jgi:hypothetical protein